MMYHDVLCKLFWLDNSASSSYERDFLLSVHFDQHHWNCALWDEALIVIIIIIWHALLLMVSTLFFPLFFAMWSRPFNFGCSWHGHNCKSCCHSREAHSNGLHASGAYNARLQRPGHRLRKKMDSVPKLRNRQSSSRTFWVLLRANSWICVSFASQGQEQGTEMHTQTQGLSFIDAAFKSQVFNLPSVKILSGCMQTIARHQYKRSRNSQVKGAFYGRSV